MGERLPAVLVHEDRGAVHRRGLLSVHGHALPGQCTPEEGQIQDQSGARIYTEFQNSPGWLQKDERG